jgi:hypothetical protein
MAQERMRMVFGVQLVMVQEVLLPMLLVHNVKDQALSGKDCRLQRDVLSVMGQEKEIRDEK